MNSSSCDLVWCSENCHKSQTKSLREELAAIASGCSAALVCLKKAAKYVGWSSSSERCLRPFALLTDWREAKPCVQACAEGGSLIITLVYCDNEQSFSRALAWARRLDPKHGCVRVLSDVKELEPLLLHALGAAQEDPTQFVSNRRAALHSRDDTCSEVEHQSLVVKPITIDKIVQQRPSLELHAKNEKPAMQHTLIHLAQCSTQMERALVMKLLILAMPDHYDD